MKAISKKNLETFIDATRQGINLIQNNDIDSVVRIIAWGNPFMGDSYAARLALKAVLLPAPQKIKTLFSDKGVLKFCAEKLLASLKKAQSTTDPEEKKLRSKIPGHVLSGVVAELEKVETITEEELKQLVEQKESEITDMYEDIINLKQAQQAEGQNSQAPQKVDNTAESNILPDAEGDIFYDCKSEISDTEYFSIPDDEDYQELFDGHKEDLVSDLVQIFFDSKNDFSSFKEKLIGEIQSDDIEKQSQQLFNALKAQNCDDKDTLLKKLQEENNPVMKIIKDIINTVYHLFTGKQTQYGYKKDIKGFAKQEIERQQQQNSGILPNL